MDASKIQTMAEKYLRAIASKKPLSAAGMLFICPEDKSIFLIQRSKNESKPLTWGTPGGKIEKDESSLEGASREILEELGASPKNKKLVKTKVFRNGDFTYTTFIYFLDKKEKDSWTPKIKLDTKENISFDWFKLDELPKKMHPGMKFLLPAIKSLLK